MCSALQAQTPSIVARKPAALGPSDRSLTEPAIAAGGNMVLSVCFEQVGHDPQQVRYAAYNVQQGQWSEGVINNGDFVDPVDVSIAYDSQTQGFVAAAMATSVNPLKRHVVTCHYTYDPQTGTGQFDPAGWVSRASRDWTAEDPEQVTPIDKPWIVAGQLLSSGQEFYIFYIDNAGSGLADGYAVLRSIDGGQCWSRDDVRFADTGERVKGNFNAQPAVTGGGPVYVAYVKNDNIRFLVGQDVNPSDPQDFDCTNPKDVGVRFLALYEPSPTYPPTTMVSIPLHSHADISQMLPRGGAGVSPQRVIQLAADPTNANRLFVAYHDTATPSLLDKDVNVYVQTVTRQGTGWVVGPRVLVNNDSTTFESDQFMPAMTVDDNGLVHFIFYDDRDHTDGPEDDLQPDGCGPNPTCQTPKFDVYYAWAPVSNLVFEDHPERNQRLFLTQNPNDEPALDLALEIFEIRDYIGICWYGDTVWTAYSGTWTGDYGPPNPNNESMLWSSQINVLP